MASIVFMYLDSYPPKEKRTKCSASAKWSVGFTATMENHSPVKFDTSWTQHHWGPDLLTRVSWLVSESGAPTSSKFPLALWSQGGYVTRRWSTATRPRMPGRDVSESYVTKCQVGAGRGRGKLGFGVRAKVKLHCPLRVLSSNNWIVLPLVLFSFTYVG